MEVVFNDHSINCQFTEESFKNYIKNDILPIMKLLSEYDIDILKSYSTYSLDITNDKKLHDFMIMKGDPIIDRFKSKLSELAYKEPYWNNNIQTKDNVEYRCGIDIIPNCITEAYERCGLLFSFIQDNYDCRYIEILCDEQVNTVRNFCVYEALKAHLSDLGYILSWNKNSFYVNSIGYKFEIRFNEGHHNVAHFHLSNANEDASISIPDVDILAGKLSKKQKVESWALQNMDKIIDLWNMCHPENIVCV